jgi:hypothetical protein
MNLNENLINAIGYFDIWPANHPAEKKLFIQSMKKAWAQKKHRDKMQGKKAYSMVMSTDIKGKLDEMAIKNELHRNELLEHIINNSYSDFLEGKLKILKMTGYVFGSGKQYKQSISILMKLTVVKCQIAIHILRAIILINHFRIKT